MGEQSVRKAVVPAAGLGTRFLPVAKAVPKELLPILGRPVVDFVVAEAIEAGCTDVCIVLGPGKEAIRRYFDVAPELEARLRAAGRTSELEATRRPGRGASIRYAYQSEPLGLGHALVCAKDFVGSDPFLFLLGDTILRPAFAPSLVAAFSELRTSLVAAERVDRDRVSRYGICSPDESSRTGRRPFRLAGLVEKPHPAEAPSDYAIAARYLFTDRIWRHLDEVSVGKGGEIQLTDAMDMLARDSSASGGIYAYPIGGKRYDLGNPIDFLAAEIEFAHAGLTAEELRRTGLA